MRKRLKKKLNKRKEEARKNMNKVAKIFFGRMFKTVDKEEAYMIPYALGF